MSTESGNMQIEQEQDAESTNGRLTQNNIDTIINSVLNAGGGIISDNKSGDWRKTLSGALDERRLFCALVILLIFYTGYSIVNATHDNKAKDEDYITRNCTCNNSHRWFYILWLGTCFSMWTICHLYFSAQKLITRCFKGCCHLLLCCNQETICKKIKCKKAYDGTEIQLINDKSFRDQCCIACNQWRPKITSCIFDNDDIHRYENYLWTQYYELYAIGVTKEIKMFSDKSVKRILLKNDETDSPGNKTSAHDEMVACPIDHYISGCYDWCKFVTHYSIHIILCIIRYLAQLVIVPLLMIQMYDTYAFLCLAADNYCTPGSEYDLHLDQTAITFGFYCGLMLSYVTSIMLHWIPQPKRKQPEENS